MKRPAPLTHAGRQTLIYLTFAGAGPSLTLVVIWAMTEALGRPSLFATFSQLALIVASAMLLVVTGLSMFVSIRAVKIGKGGFEATGDTSVDVPEAAQEVADAAQDTATAIRNNGA